MDLLTLRAAAGGGSVDGSDAASLVAAGFTLLQRSAPLVKALAGRRAAILLPTSPQFLVALAAADGRGAVLVNPLASPSEIAHQLADADVGAVFTISAFASRLPALFPHVLMDAAPVSAVVVTAVGRTTVDLGSHFGLSLEGDVDAKGRNEECAIVYTSAMAGIPLGAILSHRNLMANARQGIEAGAFSRDDHLLAVLPFSHLFGLTVSLAVPLFAGARVTTMARFNPIAAADLIDREGVTTIVGVPTVYLALLGAIDRRGGTLRTDTLRLCMCGGAPLDEELQERWHAVTGVELRQGYGLTETSPVAIFNDVRHPNRRGTLGTAMPGVGVSIRDPKTGAALPVGTAGEICVQGETVFVGYVGGATAGLPVRGGWLHTGDLGVADADGTIRFTGLSKRMFTRNGFNIYPAELERVFGAMPGVSEVRVERVPDATSGGAVHLALRGPVSGDEVRAWGETHLSAYKRPSEITVRRDS